MSSWEESTLGEVITLQRGFDLTQKEATPGPVPVISSGGCRYTTDVAKVAGPGVVTGRKGVLGKVYFAAGPYWPHDTTLWVKDFKGSDPRFIYYLLQTLPLASLDAGASNPTLNRNHAHLLPVRVPDPKTQKLAAAALAAFDDLIENNRRRIELLEQMARAIYREWFVHFRYPGHEDANFIDSPLGQIPEGWRVGSVNELCSRIQAGGTPKRSETSFWEDGEIDWYKTGDLTDSILIRSSEKISQHAVAKSSAKTFEAETVLMAIYGSPTVGRLGLVERASSANQAALGLVADPGRFSTEYLWFSLRELRGYLNQIAQGAAQQNVSKAKVVDAPVFIPPRGLVEGFTVAVAPPWRLSHQLAKASDAIAALRDLLLPKLVTGQIDVSKLDLDAVVESVA